MTVAVVLVAARCNLDRVWHLEGVLRRGGRTPIRDRVLRYGGGGTTTGRALLSLGNTVRLHGTLADDALGRRYRDDLAAEGFVTDGLRLVPGATRLVEILVEPGGERTILSAASVEHAPLTEVPTDGVDAVYVNVRRADPAVLERAARSCLVVSQVPLEPGERRPSHVLIASRSDWPPEGLSDPWPAARTIGGPDLRALVVTAGTNPTEIWTATGRVAVDVEPLPVAPPDTTGAGDAFAGALVDALARDRSVADAVAAGSAQAARFLMNRARTTAAEPGPPEALTHPAI